jgi:lipopolysaccharide export system protein LptC
MAKVPELNPASWLPRSWPLLVLVLLLVLAYWLEAALESSQQTAAPSSRQQPDFGLTGFTLRSYDADGSLRYEARGQSMQHHPGNKESLAEGVHVIALREGRPPWVMDARQARFDDAGSRTSLHGDVALRREAAPGLPAIQIYTDSLHYQPQEDFAETADPITIYRDADFIKSHGARAWLEDGKVQLLSRVRGRHPPRKEQH